MFTVEIYQATIATGATTRAQLTSIYSGMVPRLNNGFQVPSELAHLMFVAGVGASMVQVQMQAPSLQPGPYPNFNPNNRGTAFESPPRVWDFSYAPYHLNGTEELDAYASQNLGMNEAERVLVAFSDGVRSAFPLGRYMQAHATAATTLTAGGWTAVQPTFDTALPAGMYSLVGCRAFSATGLFFQMLPATAPNWRPGGIMVQAYDQMDPPNQRWQGAYVGPNQGWGEWLHFRQNVPPSVNCYATAADTAEEFWYDLIYWGPNS